MEKTKKEGEKMGLMDRIRMERANRAYLKDIRKEARAKGKQARKDAAWKRRVSAAKAKGFKRGMQGSMFTGLFSSKPKKKAASWKPYKKRYAKPKRKAQAKKYYKRRY